MRNFTLSSALVLGLSILQPLGGISQQSAADALIAAPASHELHFRNSRVRVLQVTIPPGITEPVHTHQWSNLMQIEAPQPLTYTKMNGKWIEAKRFDVLMGMPTNAQWMEPEGLHAVRNRGTADYRAIRIELKLSRPPRISEAKLSYR